MSPRQQGFVAGLGCVGQVTLFVWIASHAPETMPPVVGIPFTMGMMAILFGVGGCLGWGMIPQASDKKPGQERPH